MAFEQELQACKANSNPLSEAHYQEINPFRGLRIEVEVSCERVEWVDEAGNRAHVRGYEERRWPHLDTCQCQTLIKAKVPRVRYENGSTKMVRVPWAEDRSRFTLVFEAFACLFRQTHGV